MSSKRRAKTSRNHPFSTATISRPAVEDASDLAVLSSFSPNADLFAFLSLAVDKHRLRVYSTATSHSVADLVVDSARVSSLTWSTIDLSEPTQVSDESGNRKKRRKRESVASVEELQNKHVQVVILGLSDGTVLFFSPFHGRVIRTLSHPTSTVEILSVVVVSNSYNQIAWTSGADSSVRIWNFQKNEMLHSWRNDDRLPFTALSQHLIPGQDQVNILAAHQSIRLLSVSSGAFGKTKPSQAASFTGHASPVRQLQWDASEVPPSRFVSRADADRFLYIWEISGGSTTDGKPVASVPLDSDARCFSCAVSASKQTLLALSASGKITVYTFPSEFGSRTIPSQEGRQLPSLLPRSTLFVSSKDTSTARVVDAAFAGEGGIRIARVLGGLRPVFDVIRYLDDSGKFIQEVVIEEIKDAQSVDSPLPASTKRYAEAPSLAVSSGAQPPYDQEMDDAIHREIEGDLDVDLAELSLGQRLAIVDAQPTASDSDDECVNDVAAKSKSTPKGKSERDPGLVPASSLTRTLIQALHSSDTRLLETCLAHSDHKLIRNTVVRLPPQLAVPLITACVERLSRGARGADMKGRGGGASSQRGMGLIIWVKMTLTIHGGHLMTIPDLLARLSGLHATLTSRLMLQESLLSLSGRLDMVLSQIEMRSSSAPAPLAFRQGKAANKQGTEVVKYIEGESGEESEDNEEIEVEIESADEGGSVENVELGGQSDDESSEDEEDNEKDDSEDEDDEDADADDYEDSTMNGFIDDEAEEYSGEEDSEEDESE